MSDTVQGIVEALPARFNAEAAAEVDAVFQFDIFGEQAGQWIVTVKDQQCQIAPGNHDDPQVTFSMEDTDFVDMMTGRMSGQEAFFSGKLRVSGDLILAQRLESFFR